MGYRSEVHSVIYGKPKAMESFKNDHVDELDMLVNHMGSMVKFEKIDDNDAIILVGYDVKWYRNFEEVDIWNNLMNVANSLGLSVEYCRVGEDYDDYEYITQNTNKPYITIHPRTHYEIRSAIE